VKNFFGSEILWGFKIFLKFSLFLNLNIKEKRKKRNIILFLGHIWSGQNDGLQAGGLLAPVSSGE
jgi:hypothetical protein